MAYHPDMMLKSITTRGVPVDDASKNVSLSTFLTPPTVVQDVTVQTEIFDAWKQLCVRTDAAKASEFMVHDGAQRLCFHVKPDGSVTGFERDAFGETLVMTQYYQPLGLSLASYVDAGLPLQVVLQSLKADAKRDRTITFTRDQRGDVTAKTFGPPVQRFNGETNYVGTSEERTVYSAFRDVVSTSRLTDGASNTWHEMFFFHSALGAVVLEAESFDGPASTSEKTSMFRVKTKSYDTFGLRTQMRRYATPISLEFSSATTTLPQVQALLVSHPSDRITELSYTVRGEVAAESKVGNPNLWRQKITLDSNGRPVMEDKAYPRLQRTHTHNNLGLMMSTSHENGNTEVAQRDNRGSIVRQRKEPRTRPAVKPFTTSAATLVPLEHYYINSHKQKCGIMQFYNGAKASATDPDSFDPVRPDSARDRLQLLLHDSRGEVAFSQDAEGYVTVNTFNANGRLARQYFIRSNRDGKHVDEVRTIYDANNRVIRTETYRDSRLVDSSAQTYNIFGEATGSGPSASNLPAINYYDAVGNILASNVRDGVPTVQMRNSANHVTVVMQATQTNLMEAAKNEDQLAALVERGISDYQDVELERRQVDLLGRILRRILPRFQPGPFLQPREMPLQVLFSTSFPELGARSCSWPIPQESNILGQATLTVEGQAGSAVLTAPIQTSQTYFRQGFDVSTLPTDLYSVAIEFNMRLPTGGTGPKLFTSSGVVGVVNGPNMAAKNAFCYVLDLNEIHVTGAIAGIKELELWVEGGSSKTATVPLQSEGGELVARLSDSTTVSSGVYYGVPVASDGSRGSPTPLFQIITQGPAKVPIAREINDVVVNFWFVESHGQLEVWSSLPKELQTQQVQLQISYTDSSDDSQQETHIVKSDEVLEEYEDKDGNILQCNVELDKPIKTLDWLSVGVQDNFGSGDYIPLFVAEAPEGLGPSSSGRVRRDLRFSGQPSLLDAATTASLATPAAEDTDVPLIFKHMGSGIRSEFVITAGQAKTLGPRQSTKGNTTAALASASGSDSDSSSVDSFVLVSRRDLGDGPATDGQDAGSGGVPGSSDPPPEPPPEPPGPVKVDGTIAKTVLPPRSVVSLYPTETYADPPLLEYFDVSHDLQATWKEFSPIGTTDSSVTLNSSGIAPGVYPFRLVRNAQTKTGMYSMRVRRGGILFPIGPSTTAAASGSGSGGGSSVLPPGTERSIVYTHDVFDNITFKSIVSTDSTQESIGTQYEYNDQDEEVKIVHPAVPMMSADGTKSVVPTTERKGWNERGQQIGTEKPDKSVEAFVMDEAQQPIRFYAADGRTMRLSAFNTFGEEEAFLSPQQTLYQREHDRRGLATAMISPNGIPSRNGGQPLRSTSVYNEVGELVSDTDPAGNTRSYDRDFRGNVSVTYSPKGKAFTSITDRNNQPITEQHPGAPSTKTTKRDWWSHQLQVVDFSGATTTTTYDFKFQMVERRSQVTANQHGTKAVFQPERIYERFLIGREWTYVFIDTYKRLGREAVPGEHVKLTYTAGRLMEVRDLVDGTISTFDYNENNERVLTQVTTPDRAEKTRQSTATYDHLGRLAQFFDTQVSGETFYDTNGNKISTILVAVDPTTGAEVKSALYSSYDTANRPLIVNGVLKDGAVELAPGVGVQFAYDPLTGQRTQETWLDDQGKPQKRSITYYDDGNINTISSTVDNRVDTWVYDERNIRVKETVQGDSVSTERETTVDADGFIEQDKFTDKKDSKKSSTSTFTAEADGMAVHQQVTTQEAGKYTLVNYYMHNSSPFNQTAVSGETENEHGVKASVEMAEFGWLSNGNKQSKTGSDENTDKPTGSEWLGGVPKIRI